MDKLEMGLMRMKFPRPHEERKILNRTQPLCVEPSGGTKRFGRPHSILNNHSEYKQILLITIIA
jgi:hypothetical protein